MIAILDIQKVKMNYIKIECIGFWAIGPRSLDQMFMRKLNTIYIFSM